MGDLRSSELRRLRSQASFASAKTRPNYDFVRATAQKKGGRPAPHKESNRSSLRLDFSRSRASRDCRLLGRPTAYGYWLVLVTLISEGLLLFVAAQAGFIDSPRVMANMAVDPYLPHRFAAPSEQLSMQNGVLLMGHRRPRHALLHPRQHARRMGFAADSVSSIGIEVVAQASELCEQVAKLYPKATIFTGKLVFRREASSITRPRRSSSAACNGWACRWWCCRSGRRCRGGDL
jgi:hypothetical protein